MADLYDELDLDIETEKERRARILADNDAEYLRDLVKLRRDQKLSQDALAKRMGVTQATVAAFERYDSDPKLSTLRRYAYALGALVKHVVVPDEGQFEDGTEWQLVSLRVKLTPGDSRRSFPVSASLLRTTYAPAA